MNWKELTIHTSEQAVEMITNFLHEAGAGGVTIEEAVNYSKLQDTSFGQFYELQPNGIAEGEARIKGYFPETSEINGVIAQIKPRIEELSDFGIDTGEVDYQVKDVHEDDWANNWKQYFKPIRVSERLTIKPTWEAYTPSSPDERIIEIDPGMAFGTGTHPTTALCLRALEGIIREGDEVVDVGTGSGILAIGSILLGAKHVLAIDLDPVAVASAKENTLLNQLDDHITVHESDLLAVLNQGTEGLGVKLPVRIVVANILAEVILLFIDDVYQALEPGGYYITSGIYKNKEALVQEALIASGFEIVEAAREEDWVAFVARKR
ncbi:ribosomal protein L11 methyltransferase [Paenibacillus shirakamiensis]|uniref:Ribosomal protein L11 methyltransferase n=1 Tax=Paenibacillus shirakamiensis TaxID=1265935 RepID=A0ABS4JBQ4_9BACL|nr:50S ribosomal protein L11 methyltransferase [Paenibacillus shirakamiensis]MBP1999149.1 ribosomal protein L11 methyltransferase [Paenibacillus shirakamiensis]